MRNLGRFVRTLAYLKPGQIIHQALRRLPRSKAVAVTELPRRTGVAPWQMLALHTQSMIARDRFRFLAEEGEIVASNGWNDDAKAKLWTYNLHYFDDLLAEGASERAAWHTALIARWIQENPHGQGAGWDAYTLSRRIVNWIISDLSGSALPDDAYQSLAIQGRALRRSIEYHLRGNHLFINAKALIFLGSFFEGDEADEWLATGLRIVNSEIDEQILADGGHFELSPMYHALILEDLLDLIQAGTIFPDRLGRFLTIWSAKAAAMLRWLAVMSHPDGEISFFNDAALGEARNLSALTRYAKALAIDLPEPAVGSTFLEQSGYARLVSPNWTALVDVAAIGASYIPGHGHADTLSFELSAGLDRIVTNGGTSTYEMNARRQRERGTCSHATVEINGNDSSEVWASFRVGRRARTTGVVFSRQSNSVAARHDGYRYLPHRPVHERQVVVDGQQIRVSDRVKGGDRYRMTGRFPLHPNVKIVHQLDDGWKLSTSSGVEILVRIDGPVELKVEDGYYASEFGVRVARPVLTWHKPALAEAAVTTEFEVIRT